MLFPLQDLSAYSLDRVRDKRPRQELSLAGQNRWKGANGGKLQHIILSHPSYEIIPSSDNKYYETSFQMVVRNVYRCKICNHASEHKRGSIDRHMRQRHKISLIEYSAQYESGH